MDIVFKSVDFQQMNPLLLAELLESLKVADCDPMKQRAEHCFLPLLGPADGACPACMWSDLLDCSPTDHALPLRPRNAGRGSIVALEGLQPPGLHFPQLTVFILTS